MPMKLAGYGTRLSHHLFGETCLRQRGQPAMMYILALLACDHGPRIVVRSMEPWLRKSHVAPPRRKEYGLKRKLCNRKEAKC